MSLLEITFIAAIGIVVGISAFLSLAWIMDTADRLKNWIHERRANRDGVR